MLADVPRYNQELVGQDEGSIAFVADILGSYRQLGKQLIRRLSVSETAKLNWIYCLATAQFLKCWF